jgi:hypothetical protein
LLVDFERENGLPAAGGGESGGDVGTFPARTVVVSEGQGGRERARETPARCG